MSNYIKFSTGEQLEYQSVKVMNETLAGYIRSVATITTTSAAYDDVAALYVVDGKTKPKYTLIDGLKRIEQVMQSALSEDVWGEYCKKMGTYGPDSLGEDKPEGRRERMHRLAGEMWHTFNCHNFAEVFRVYCPGSANPNIYDAMYDVNRLSDPELSDDINFISERYAKTHDLAWSIIGLDECINWDDWKSHYYGDMIREILLKLKENDEAVLRRIRAIIQKL